MSAQTGIEWTDATWNPIRGVHGKWSCVKVSPGCANCYAEAINHRFTGLPYVVGADSLRLDEKALTEPLRWKKPRRVFVCSMADLFEDRVKDEWIDRIFDVMTKARQHTFQVLTKRASRMSSVFGPDGIGLYLARGPVPRPWPNIWLGVSVEDQERADERIPFLLQTPAAVRFVSYEPALSAVDFTRVAGSTLDALRGHDFELIEPWPDSPPRLDWVIVGGESGPGARPFDLAWARSAVKQCRAAGVPVFVKQLGASPQPEISARHIDGGQMRLTPNGARLTMLDRKGGDPSEWPEDLRVREFPA